MKELEYLENILDKLTNRKIKNKGLGIFALERAKFEGWLKVEIIDLLIKDERNAKPEIDNIDIVYDEINAIELKMVNTSYNYNELDVEPKTRPITDNINSIIKDICKLKKTNYENKFIIFIVFPLSKKNYKFWNRHKEKIENNDIKLKCKKFNSSNGVPGVLYYGQIGNIASNKLLSCE